MVCTSSLTDWFSSLTSWCTLLHIRPGIVHPFRKFAELAVVRLDGLPQKLHPFTFIFGHLTLIVALTAQAFALLENRYAAIMCAHADQRSAPAQRQAEVSSGRAATEARWGRRTFMPPLTVATSSSAENCSGTLHGYASVIRSHIQPLARPGSVREIH